VSRARVLQALDAMLEEDRLVLALELCEGLSADETARLLQRSPRTVLRTRDRLHTALRRAVGGAPLRRRAEAPVARLRSAV
jgi:DNA-directed RNA polymerase specialized sigma24 family protein